jgi:hypothetical protein
MTTTSTVLPFQPITPHLAIGTESIEGWRAIHTLPLIILVGVTGVGKSTLLNELAQHEAHHLLLPDRRDLTDQLIISTMQAAYDVPITPVTDRGQRFAYTRRYRELYPGGMAHALSQLWVSADAPALLVFDGLRGANEVEYAAATLPQARFVMLDAPDLVRLQRLLGRGDAFDHIQITTPTKGNAATFSDLGVPEASAIFTSTEEATILSWLHHGVIREEELRGKLQIVIEERRSYDPVATLEALRAHAPHSTLYIDTVTHAPDAVASQVIHWLNLPMQ